MSIDSDTRQIGWFSANEDRVGMRYGTIILGRGSLEDRLLRATIEIRGLLLSEGPDVVAVEMPYLGLNVQTTIKLAVVVGIIRAFAWLSAAEVIEFQPSEGKAALSGYSQINDDGMVEAMWMSLLGISVDTVDRDRLDPHMAHAMGGYEFARAKLWERKMREE